MLMCVFVHSRFVENPSIGSWETNSCFFRGVLSHSSTTVNVETESKLIEHQGGKTLREDVGEL
jgi:hypothetical protein